MQPKRILYIEDNFQNRRLVRKILFAAGYDVIEAEDAASGISIAHAERPDLIFMDINMAGLDGMEATAALKKSEVAHIPIIALIAAAMKGDRERIMSSGCDEYLQKPISKAQLLETVARFLNGSRL